MSALVRWEPFRDMVNLRGRMDRLFDQLAGHPWENNEGLAATPWNPPVDVYETNGSIILKADLPDVKQNDVEIAIEGNTLTIKGERKRESEVQEKSYYRIERSYGTFTRSFTLPPTIDTEKIDASFSQGVLKLTLPKREESKPKQIKVKVNGEGK